jgi:hypothetical protein
MKIRMLAVKAFRPTGSGSKLIQPGEPFEADNPAQAQLYRAIGRAVDAPAQAAEPPPAVQSAVRSGYPTRAIEAQQPAAEPAVMPAAGAEAPAADVDTSSDEAPADKPRRAYRRRDQTAAE